MKYITAIFGIISIIFVTILNFYPDKVRDFIDEKILKKEFIIAKANDYYLNSNFEYLQNYTDDV